MRIVDLLSQSATAISRQKRRNAVSAFGIAWGVASVLILAGWGVGVEHMLKAGMNSLGDNIIFVFEGHTSKGIGGYRAGRIINLYPEDVDAIKAYSSKLKWVVAEDQYSLAVSRGAKTQEQTIRAVVPDAMALRNLAPEQGRFITPDDISERRRVCYLGKKIREQFFEKTEDPLGQELRLGGIRFTVVGLLPEKRQMANIGDRDDNIVFIPLSTGRSLFAGGHRPVFCIEGRAFDINQSEEAATEIRKALAAKYHFAPDDEEAAFILPMTRFTKMLDRMAAALRIFVAGVGMVTLAIGGIGVMNMMLVSVNERIGEIGVRRAVGGERRWIIWQVLTETFFVTMVAGLIGLAIGLLVLFGFSKLPLPDTVPLPILSWKITLLTVGVMVGTAVLSGITPARRAASIPPVQAIKGDFTASGGRTGRRHSARIFPGLFGEIVSQAVEDIRASRLRAVLTGFGVFWGVAAVALLLGWGEGTKVGMLKNLEQIGGRRTAIYPRRVESPISGMRRAQYLRFANADIDDIKTNAWYIEHFTPEIDIGFPVAEHGSESRAVNTLGVVPDVKIVRNFEVAQGRFINQRDLDERRKIAFIGAAVKEKLFPTSDAVASSIRIKGVPFLVVGVAVKKGDQTSIENSLDDDKILIPYTTAELLSGQRQPQYFQLHPTRAIPYKEVEKRLRDLILKNHNTDKEDAVAIYSALEAVEDLSKMQRGLGVFLGGVGLVTLLIGGIGVANVMFVSVAQRTREIGIRRAIGAKKSHIFLQFVSEAIMICFAGGLAGILVAIGISKVMSVLPLPKFFAAPQINGLLLLAIFGFIAGAGVISGAFPARKASNCDVIESLHYE
ncbi:MAG TPA: ABC transporter permease [bacterium]|nr:ABC transporter permease [bacterium]